MKKDFACFVVMLGVFGFVSAQVRRIPDPNNTFIPIIPQVTSSSSNFGSPIISNQRGYPSDNFAVAPTPYISQQADYPQKAQAVPTLSFSSNRNNFQDQRSRQQQSFSQQDPKYMYKYPGSSPNFSSKQSPLGLNGGGFTKLDKGIDISDYPKVLHFAIRSGTNAVTTQVYITAPPSCKGTLYFQTANGLYLNPGTNQLFLAIQLPDKSWVLQSKSCPFHFIRLTSSMTIELQMGPYLSSKFWIKYMQDHHHFQSWFEKDYFWIQFSGNAGNELQVGYGYRTRQIVEFWSEFEEK